MKKIFVFLILNLSLFAQGFRVIKVKGKAEVLKGATEKWVQLKIGQTLSANDIVATGKNSLLVLKSEEGYFKLESNAALKLNYVRRLTLDELLLALTMDEIKNLHYKSEKGESQNTAIYGSKITSEAPKPNNIGVEMGIKQINGARALSENGFLKSAVLAARETFSKYPTTRKRFEDRVYFASLLTKLGLYNEAIEDFQGILTLKLSAKQKALVYGKISEAKKEIIRKSN